MSKIKFPDFLEVCLLGSQYRPAIRTFADEVGELISANKTPFFPEYTDHGVDHLNAVLASAVNLIPENVKKKREHGKPKWFTDADATVLIGAVLLHDIAMHLRPAGFLELIDPDSKFGRNSDDKPWHELWADYQHEARRFTDETLTNLLGRKQSGGFKWVDLPEYPSSWNANTERIVGEFIRRHHPRIAHDIAHCGFPGHHDNQPLLQLSKNVEIRSLEDQIGFTARSHGIDLRVASKYLIDVYDNPRRHNGAATLYIMGLLRIADYLQIERDRAPLILLNLDQPQSPVSLAEWHKHRAVLRSNAGKSSEARSFKINPDLNHSTFIQLRTLLKKMQRELDQTNAVLAQELCDEETKRLRLSLRSIESDLDNRRFLDSLPYFPEETRFAADPNILPLLVEPLYGDNPSVGVRELLQNAVDAVRERRVLCEKNGTTMEPIAEADDPDTDILVEYIESPKGQWTLRIQDRGIGMTPETIRDYFLRVGVSFKDSPIWTNQFLDNQRQPIVTRVGRFGIGVLSTFLLGPNFTVTTRNSFNRKGEGILFRADKYNSITTLNREQNAMPFGTTVEVPITIDANADPAATKKTIDTLSSHQWYTSQDPKTQIRVQYSDAPTQLINTLWRTPGSRKELTPDWNEVDGTSFEFAAWSWNAPGAILTINGFSICSNPTLDETSCEFTGRGAHSWRKRLFSSPYQRHGVCPRIAVNDNKSELPVWITRFGISTHAGSMFEQVERDCVYSIIAYALLYGGNNAAELNVRSKLHPLQRKLSDSSLWLARKSGGVLLDPWLVKITGSPKVHVVIRSSVGEFADIDFDAELEISNHILSNSDPFGSAVLNLLVEFDISEVEESLPRDLPEDEFALEMRESILSLSEWQVRRRLQDFFTDFPDMNAVYSQRDKSRIESDSELLQLVRAIDMENDLFSFGTLTFSDIPDAPRSMIAKVWNETIGPNVIPYDPDARRHLIEQARKHPDMRRHLEKWERLGPTGEPLSAD